MNVTADTRIVFVHGLASKPPQDALHKLWCKTLIESVRLDSQRLAQDMAKNPNLFHSAYWANAVPDHIEDSGVQVNKLRQAVDSIIGLRIEQGREMHIGKKGWIAAKAKKFGLHVVNALATALTVKDDAIENFMTEINLYQGDQKVADEIRRPLEEELRSAWDDPGIRRLVIISHSMGTFIAYDVLWRFSHRSEQRYRRYRNRKVEHLITMGSPLGDPVLRSFMLIERWKDAPKGSAKKPKVERQRYYPTNVEGWHNYSAHGDVVCHDAKLEDDFFKGFRKHVGDYSKDTLRDYVGLYNPYVNREGKANPHKSYGYLIQPKLSQNMMWFFRV
jgi:hypothetical protein